MRKDAEERQRILDAAREAGHTHVAVRFNPQAWHDDYARNVDPEGPQDYLVPIEDALDNDGNLVEGHSGESDRLKDHPRAPEWVRGWTGPFSVEVAPTNPDDRLTTGARTAHPDAVPSVYEVEVEYVKTETRPVYAEDTDEAMERVEDRDHKNMVKAVQADALDPEGGE